MTATSIDPPMGELVSITVSGTDQAVRVTAVGEIDSTSAPELADRLTALLDASVGDITVDLDGVTFLDSAGICALAGAHRRASGQGARLRVVASGRAVVRPLQITGLWHLLTAPKAPAPSGG